LPRLLKTIKSNLTLAETHSATVYRLAHQDWSSEEHLLSGEGSRSHGGRWNPRASLLRLTTASKPRVAAAPVPRERARALAERLLIAGVRTAYASCELETCLIEHLWYAKRFAAGNPLPDDYWEDYRLGVVAVTLERVLDLTSIAVLSALGLRPEQLIEEWLPEQHRGNEALTQAIGRAARVNGLLGLIVPSARRNGFANLAMFPDNWHEQQPVQILRVRTIPQEFRSFL
jgi:RES domain-containing protein